MRKFFTEETQLINTVGMIKLGTLQLANIDKIVVPGSSHQWLLKPLGKVGNSISKAQVDTI